MPDALFQEQGEPLIEDMSLSRGFNRKATTLTPCSRSKFTLPIEFWFDAPSVGSRKASSSPRVALQLKQHAMYRQLELFFRESNADSEMCVGIDGTALAAACYSGNEAAVKILLDRGADINALNEDGDSALGLASWNGHENVVKILLEKGADLNIGRSALRQASRLGRENIVKMLVEKGAVMPKEENESPERSQEEVSCIESIEDMEDLPALEEASPMPA